MNKFKGLLIDDEKDNYDTYARYMRGREIDVVPFFELPENVDEIYNIILNNDVDFVIIDKELGKQSVAYSGLDVLRMIRKNDREIYIMFLTNNDIGENMDELGEFDQIIKKKDFATEFDMIIKRLERGLSRELSFKMEREICEANRQRQIFLDKQIDILKEKLDSTGK